jgi:hypothetical protein
MQTANNNRNNRADANSNSMMRMRIQKPKMDNHVMHMRMQILSITASARTALVISRQMHLRIHYSRNRGKLKVGVMSSPIYIVAPV